MVEYILESTSPDWALPAEHESSVMGVQPHQEEGANYNGLYTAIPKGAQRVSGVKTRQRRGRNKIAEEQTLLEETGKG